MEVLPASVRRNRKMNKPCTRRQTKIEAPARVTYELRPMIKKEKPALKFFRKYATGMLQTLNLSVASDGILQLLHDSCTKLEVLTIGCGFEHREFLPVPGVRTVDLSLMPPSIVRLKIQSGWGERGRIVPPNTLEGLAKHPLPKLRELVLERHVAFSAALFRRLSLCTRLRKLCLISFERVNDLSPIAKRLIDLEELTLQSCIRETATTKKVLQQIAGNMQNLTRIKLRAGPTQPDEFRSIDASIGSLSCCKKLKRVWIENIQSFSVHGFTRLAKGLPHLQEVTLVDCEEIDDGVLEVIRSDLRNLKVLQLERLPRLTDFGMKLLLNHPSLEHLEVVGKLQTTRVFPTPKIICDIAGSMDKLAVLKVLITGHPPTDIMKPHFKELHDMCPNLSVTVWLRPDVTVDFF